ncbi:apolipoprotein D and lipocalin family protein [Algoriphagus ratkowskyi]|uniref:Lipocalin family protein n=1 Tax=Algoriphagus ratkowskyi TaxID=57028 RepID=A0A2W7RGY0_9BACT|nr:lipocalin family protein [Algoriphagus ratkowskyi]PZX60183.1 apolipoprotein D and lipocalin family protein [Algoriphagus ratkowskyi]TXD78008.1 lipocalin family protein [Algoriphagus ratkowskyi]
MRTLKRSEKFALAMPIIAAAGIMLLSSTRAKAQDLETVPYVDLDKYAGDWYEIASFPQSFQKGCTYTKATYSANEDGTIKVVNSCYLPEKGSTKTSTAKAWVEDGSGNAKLKVQFFWPFKGKYWIIDLAKDYSYAVVGHPNRKYLWILSRTPEMDAKLYSYIIERAEDKGFDLSKLVKTVQNED